MYIEKYSLYDSLTYDRRRAVGATFFVDGKVYRVSDVSCEREDSDDDDEDEGNDRAAQDVTFCVREYEPSSQVFHRQRWLSVDETRSMCAAPPPARMFRPVNYCGNYVTLRRGHGYSSFVSPDTLLAYFPSYVQHSGTIRMQAEAVDTAAICDLMLGTHTGIPEVPGALNVSNSWMLDGLVFVKTYAVAPPNMMQLAVTDVTCTLEPVLVHMDTVTGVIYTDSQANNSGSSAVLKRLQGKRINMSTNVLEVM